MMIRTEKGALIRPLMTWWWHYVSKRLAFLGPASHQFQKCELSNQTRDAHPMSFQGWAIVYDAGQTLKQHWMHISRLSDSPDVWNCPSVPHEAITQALRNLDSTLILADHRCRWSSNGYLLLWLAILAVAWPLYWCSSRGMIFKPCTLTNHTKRTHSANTRRLLG